MRQERQRAPGSNVEVLPDVLPEDDRSRLSRGFEVGGKEVRLMDRVYCASYARAAC